MQPLASGAKLEAYHAHLLSSHDFQIYVDVLNLDEQLTGSATFLDGQKNILPPSNGPVRQNATLTLSDPAGALDFSDGSAWSGTHIWVDRLVRVRHVVDVPGYGEITAVPFIGPPTAISRDGAEVQVALADKAALAIRGARPYTAVKGANAVKAIKTILEYCTGEFRFRFPTNPRRLSKAYSVGWSDEASPALIAGKIASAELGMQLLVSCDGYWLLRPLPSDPVADLGYVTEVANASADFSSLSNFAIVNGAVKSKKVGANTVTTRPISTATVAESSSVSPERLQRKGVVRRLPVVITEDAYKNVTQTATRAKAEVAKGSKVGDEIGATVVPMLHLDADDIGIVHPSDTSSRTIRLQQSSIPFGVGGDMTLGHTAWVSKVAAPRVASHVRRTVKRAKKKKRRHRGRG